jgi:Fur family transcriptional regulator, ferric uptake regulator
MTHVERGTPGAEAASEDPWRSARERLRERGLRWTPQRRLLIEVLATTKGHVTGAELVERCRRLDPATVPSTVYRTLDVLEDLGLLRHAHGVDGREEFHVLPGDQHGHLHCTGCGRSWDIDEADAAEVRTGLGRRHGFVIDLSHLTVVGRCRQCEAADEAGGGIPHQE